MHRGIKILFFISLIGLAVAFFWNSFPLMKESVHFVLDPTAGKILKWNTDWGMVILAGIISLITSILQKYTTDQTLLKAMRAEQKMLSAQMKEYKENPDKILEIQRKQMELIPKTMDITLRPALYTAIPFILLIRWFGDFFAAEPVKIFGFFSWIWAYLVFAIVFSMVFRKLFKLP